jgi:hypothetical protein
MLVRSTEAIGCVLIVICGILFLAISLPKIQLWFRGRFPTRRSSDRLTPEWFGYDRLRIAGIIHITVGLAGTYLALSRGLGESYLANIVYSLLAFIVAYGYLLLIVLCIKFLTIIKHSQ